MTDSNQLAIQATRFRDASKAQWASLVFLAADRNLPPKKYDAAAKRLAELSDKGTESIKRGLRAVRYALDQGKTTDELIALGEKKVRGLYVNGKTKARSAPLVAFPHRVTPEIRDGLQELYLRVGRVLGLKTYDETTEFLISAFADLSDDELRHLAGGDDVLTKKNSHPLTHR